MPGQHALLSPSASKRWLSCPPSARLEAKLNDRFGEKSSSYAAEGTLAHSVAELKLRHELGELNDFNFKTQLAALGSIPEKMHRNTDYYADIVLEKYYAARKSCPDAKLFVETKLLMDDWAPHCHGTGDAVIVSDELLEVIDYKNGSGVPVSAIENPQARLYGLGGISAYGPLYGFDSVRNTIVQPNLDSVTEETLSRADLLAWGESIKPTAQLAWEGKGEFCTGEHCRFCAARAICAARAAEAMSVFRYGFDTPGVIPDESVPGILEVLPTAKAWISDMEAYALNQAKLGQNFAGFKLVHGRRPGRKWTREQDVIDILARAGYTPEQYEQQGLRSVAEIEKVLGRSAFDALLGELVTQGEGALTLVPDTDTRLEYTSAEAALSDLLD
jgi:hypothetical protein